MTNNYASNLGFLTCLSVYTLWWKATSVPVIYIILDRIDRELLHPLERLELKFGLSSEFFDKIPVRIYLDVLFRVFRFSKASFCPLTSSFMTF